MNEETTPKYKSKNREKLRILQERENKFIQTNPNPDNGLESKITTNFNKLYNEPLNSNSNFFLKNTKKVISWFGLPTRYDDLSFYSRWWRTLDILITLSNFGTLFFCSVDYEMNFSMNRHEMREYNSFRIYAILLSFFGVFCICVRHYLKYKWANVKIVEKISVENAYGQNAEDEWLSEDKFIVGERRKFLQKGLLFDIVMNLILPYPGLDYRIMIKEFDQDENREIEVPFLLSDIMFLFVIMRFLICLIRALVNYSSFTNHFAHTLCKEYGVKNNIRFAIKCILKTEHIKIVVLSFYASAIILGWAFRVIERPFWTIKGRKDMDQWLIPVWICTITMYTIGYGDYVAMTALGKILTMIIGLWGTFNNSLIIVCLSGLLDMGNDQFLVFVNIVKSKAAMKFIETAYEYHRQKKGGNKETTVRFKDVVAAYQEFKGLRNESKSIYRSNGLNYYSMKLFKEMKKIQNRLDVIEIQNNRNLVSDDTLQNKIQSKYERKVFY